MTRPSSHVPPPPLLQIHAACCLDSVNSAGVRGRTHAFKPQNRAHRQARRALAVGRRFSSESLRDSRRLRGASPPFFPCPRLWMSSGYGWGKGWGKGGWGSLAEDLKLRPWGLGGDSRSGEVSISHFVCVCVCVFFNISSNIKVSRAIFRTDMGCRVALAFSLPIKVLPCGLSEIGRPLGVPLNLSPQKLGNFGSFEL